MPRNPYQYPPNWKDTIRPEALKRANYKCQVCGVVHHKEIIWEPSGIWVERDRITELYAKEQGLKWKRVVLHVHHVNGVTLDNRPINLQVLCPKHHSKATFHTKAMVEKWAICGDAVLLAKELNQFENVSAFPRALAVLRAESNRGLTLRKIYDNRKAQAFKDDYTKQLKIAIRQAQNNFLLLQDACARICFTVFNQNDWAEFWAKYSGSDRLILGGNVLDPINEAEQ